MSVARAQREISSREFAEWMAYDLIDPIGARRADYHAALIAASIFNARRTKDSQHYYEPSEFMPTFWEPPVEPEEIDPDEVPELIEQAKAFAEALGGTFVAKA